jgi:hypothetical protein
MSTLIVVNIVPNVPTTGLVFQSYLDGLSVTANDRTVRDTSPDLQLGEQDVVLGTASGVVPLGTDSLGNETLPAFQVQPGSNPLAYERSIVQHYTAVTTSSPSPIPGGPSGTVTTYLPLAAATALIVVNLDPKTYPEYANPTSFDVRIAYTRNLTPGKPPDPVAMPLTIEYNIIAYSMLDATPPASDITGNPNTYAWALQLPVSLYSWLPPPPPSASVASVVLGDPSTPPNFFTLAAAINLVLAADPPPGCTELEKMKDPLTVAQCSEIASEIMYERSTDPPPPPPIPSPFGIELFYDTSLNQKLTDPSNSNSPTWVGQFFVSLFCRNLLSCKNKNH